MNDVYQIPEFLRRPVEAPRERPIIFSAPMVRSLLAGTKLQTRRAIKPVGNDEGFVIVERDDKTLWPWRSDDGESMLTTIGGFTHEIPMSCPYGKPGDRLYVRENAWQRPERTQKMLREGADTWPPFIYDADYWPGEIPWEERDNLKTWGWKRRPSIHLPRIGSRILLEIVAVRVERLTEISEADAQAEGCAIECMRPTGDDNGSAIWGPGGYAALWDSINGVGAWATNPYVWVLQFRRI